MKIARPLPVEYLIIDIPTGFPSSNSQIESTFNDTCSLINTPFCIENRTKTGELQVEYYYSTISCLRIKFFHIGYGYIHIVFTTIFGI